MTKNVVFCADGTWNGPEEATGRSVVDGPDDAGELPASKVTNVVKLFANLSGQVTPETLALQKEQEKALVDEQRATRQIGKYIHGVGDSDNPIRRILGGAFGMGVIARIVRGYTFISRNYVPGDAIHIAGFSRGAYTARALAGMIASVGLLNPAKYDPADKQHAYRLGIAAWEQWRRSALGKADKLTDLANALLNLVVGAVADRIPDGGLLPVDRIESVGVWDTVGSMGIPVYAGRAHLDVFRFADTKLSDKVRHGFHAMAIDEQREDFPVTKWDDRTDISQVWFVGAHADVGGGYIAAESGLSNIALSWMMKKLSDAGVRITTPLHYPPTPQVPSQAIHTPWEEPPFNLRGRADRDVRQADVFHASVARRWDGDHAYRLPGFPALTA